MSGEDESSSVSKTALEEDSGSGSQRVRAERILLSVEIRKKRVSFIFAPFGARRDILLRKQIQVGAVVISRVSSVLCHPFSKWGRKKWKKDLFSLPFGKLPTGSERRKRVL